MPLAPAVGDSGCNPSLKVVSGDEQPSIIKLFRGSSDESAARRNRYTPVGALNSALLVSGLVGPDQLLCEVDPRLKDHGSMIRSGKSAVEPRAVLRAC